MKRLLLLALLMLAACAPATYEPRPLPASLGSFECSGDPLVCTLQTEQPFASSAWVVVGDVQHNAPAFCADRPYGAFCSFEGASKARVAFRGVSTIQGDVRLEQGFFTFSH